MPYKPSVHDEVLVDKSVMPGAGVGKRLGVIVRIADVYVGSNQYQKIYFVRNAHDDMIQCRFGQFVAVKRRHIDGSVVS